MTHGPDGKPLTSTSGVKSGDRIRTRLADGEVEGQILEELRNGERDVASLARATGLAHSSVSQHLMVLRAHRVVAERREGRRVFYRLRSVELADWLVKGMDFLAPMNQQNDEVRKAIKKAQTIWSD